MKKIICLLAVVLMVASVAFAQKKMAITANDLAGLQGFWTGNLSFGIQEGTGSTATLQIFNDKVPVQAKLTINQIPDVLASSLGLSSGQNVFESNDGTITSQGTIVWTGATKSFFEVTKAGDKKLKCDYWFKGLRGDAVFTKK
jgi:uncharacterized GH25 family protein